MLRVGFSMSKGLGGVLSRVICYLTGAKASHAWLCYESTDFGAVMVIEAHESGIRLVTLKRFTHKSRVVATFLLPAGPYMEAEVLRTLGRTIGEPYDFAGLFGMLWVLLGRRLHRRWRNPLRSRRAQFCSEIVARALRELHYPGAEKLVPDACTPGELMTLLAATKPGAERVANDV